MIITGFTTRIIEIDASPRFGDKGIPAHRPQKWQYPMVCVHTDTEIEGYSMIYGPHGDGKSMSDILFNTFFRDIVGKNPLHTEAIWQNLRHKCRHLYNLTDALAGVIDVALWDIKGKTLNTSVCDLLGRYRNKIKTYATGRVYLPTAEEIFDEARQVKQAGHHAYKLQLWQGPEADIPRFHAAREAVGPDFPLMQDASGGYSYAEAYRVGKVLEQLKYYWFEEPVRDRQMHALHALQRELNLPLLVGESVSLDEMSNYLSPTIFGLLRGDVLIKGGITGLQKAFGLCDILGINLEIHTAGTPILDVANLHVACANKNCEFVELHHPIFRFGLKNSPLEQDEEGYLHLPEGPGLGIQPDWDWIENHTVDFKLKKI